MTDIRGATALVTGASTGIGAATARALARKGARVILVARSHERLERLAEEIAAAGGEAHARAADVGDPGAVSRLAITTLDDFGAPDIIVNNAGAGRWLFIDETEPEELVQQMAVPFFAAFYVTHAFVDDMLLRGSGHIVNVNTPVSRVAWPGAIGYASARWALRGFTEALRADLTGTGLRVTELVPTKVSSDYFRNNPGAEERLPRLAKLLPTLTPEQAAEALVRAVERDAREVSTPLAYRLMVAQARLFPRLASWLMARTGAKPPSGLRSGERKPEPADPPA